MLWERLKPLFSYFCIPPPPALQMRWDTPLCSQPLDSVARRVDVFIPRWTKVWVTGWPLREALCFAQPVGCLLSAKSSSSLGKTHAPLRTDLMQSAIYSKSFRSQCDSMVGNRSHCLTSWVSNFSHCTTVPAGNVLERQIPRPAQTPWIKGSRFGAWQRALWILQWIPVLVGM